MQGNNLKNILDDTKKLGVETIEAERKQGAKLAHTADLLNQEKFEGQKANRELNILGSAGGRLLEKLKPDFLQPKTPEPYHQDDFNNYTSKHPIHVKQPELPTKTPTSWLSHFSQAALMITSTAAISYLLKWSAWLSFWPALAIGAGITGLGFLIYNRVPLNTLFAHPELSTDLKQNLNTVTAGLEKLSQDTVKNIIQDPDQLEDIILASEGFSEKVRTVANEDRQKVSTLIAAEEEIGDITEIAKQLKSDLHKQNADLRGQNKNAKKVVADMDALNTKASNTHV